MKLTRDIEIHSQSIFCKGKKLTGVIGYRDEFIGLNKYLSGNIILNDSAEVKLEDKMILELKEALFRKPMSG